MNNKKLDNEATKANKNNQDKCNNLKDLGI